jgi:hypothetical protein
MSQIHHRLFLRNFCAYFASLEVIFSATTLLSQVPANVPFARNLAAVENSISAGRTVVKVMARETAIPFGEVQGSQNSALLDMKGNDQEYVRNFKFKNTSSVSYTINSVDFEKQDNMFEFMSVEPDESLPIDVPPGHTFTIRIAFHAIQLNLLCSNKLNIKTEQSKEPISYSIQAKQQSWQTLPKIDETASALSN